MLHSIFERDFVHNVYDTIADAFNQSRFCYWNAVQTFLDGLSKNSIILDNGCGNGKYLAYRKDVTFIGNDMCLPLLDICKKKADVSYANGLNLPYRNNCFDAVICVAVLHHLSTSKRRQDFVNEMIRVLKINGEAIITVWAREQNHKRFEKWIVHENGDAMIPWKNKKGDLISQRYYHLFTENELKDYFERADSKIEIIKCFFEFENWCIHIKKLK